MPNLSPTAKFTEKEKQGQVIKDEMSVFFMSRKNTQEIVVFMAIVHSTTNYTRIITE